MDATDHGPLSGGSLQKLVETWHRQSLSGVVWVESGFGIGQIAFESGQIVNAELGSLRAEAALGRLVSASSGRYRVEPSRGSSGSSPQAVASSPPIPASSATRSPLPVDGARVNLPPGVSPRAQQTHVALNSIRPLETVKVSAAPLSSSRRSATLQGLPAASGNPPPALGGPSNPRPLTESNSGRLIPNIIVSVEAGPGAQAATALGSSAVSARATVQQSASAVPPSAEDPHDLSPGAVVARYEVLSLLGQGETGTVYLVRLRGQGGFERLFALKVLRPRFSAHSDAAAALLREAQVMSRVNHTNVVSVLDVGIHAGCAFVVMNYVRGCSLLRLLEAKSQYQSPRTLVPALLDALAGLHALHSAQSENGVQLQLVHHDISPHNFLVGLDGVCRLSDLGFAGLTEFVARAGSVEHRGTAEYLAPERIRGESADARADLFAFGALIWTALTGRVLFEAASVQETQRNVLELPILPPSRVSSSPACLDHICLRALEREPSKRFQSANDMIRELRRVAIDNDLLGSPAEVASWVKDVVGSGSNFSATGKRSLAHDMARLDYLSDETPFEVARYDPSEQPKNTQTLQWSLALLAIVFFILASLSPEFLEMLSFGLIK